jgi:Ca-activated chloride channel family protein
VWALRRIGDLVDQIRLLGRKEKELVDEIVSLSLRFGIVTEYTSFLADERTDPSRLADSRLRAFEELSRPAGGAAAPADGVAASENQKLRREADRPAPAPSSPAEAGKDGGPRQGYAKASAGGRDLVEETVEGVKQVANRSFYKRANVQNRAYAWVDVEVKDTAQVDETVVRWSPRFFEVLAATTPEENARLSQEGDLLLRLQGRNVFVTDPAPTDR